MRAPLSRPIFVLVAPVVAALLLLPSAAAPAAGATQPDSNPSEITAIGSLVFFAATTAAHGRELWVTNGTAAGTREVADINPAPGTGSDPNQLTPMGNKVYFFADDGTGRALWKSDGTSVDTRRLGGGASYGHLSLVGVGNRLFFETESSGGIQSTLWTSDGTVTGTRSIAVVGQIANWFGAGLGSFYFFFANNGDDSYSLWKSDGTSAGTSAVMQIPSPYAPDEESYDPTEMVTSGNQLYFLMEASDMASGFYRDGDLWQSDGTAAGTRQVRDFEPGETDWVSSDLTDLDGTLYFGADDQTGIALWKSDGSSASTRIVRRIAPDEMRVVGSRLFLFADDGTGMALWRTRGTARTTVKVYPISLPEFCAWWTNGPYCRLDRTPAAVASRLFFPASSVGNGTELWVSDGTAAGTRQVKNIVYGGGSSNPSELTAVGSLLYFSARDANHGRELWVSDGTARGTHMVMDINPG